jgi:hypothetical protein
MCESQTASNYSSDTDLPKFEAAELRRVLELLESLAVTEPQKIARSHRLSRPPHRKRSEPGRASGGEGVWTPFDALEMPGDYLTNGSEYFNGKTVDKVFAEKARLLF